MSSSSTTRPPRSTYIVGPVYDWAFFLGPPVAALLLGIALSGTHLANETFVWSGQWVTATGLGLGIFIHAHLVLVLYRSHANRNVLRQHPYRFSLVPGMLLLAMLVSPVAAVCCSVLATFWDVYHSGAQTFGFGRIYDAKRGNDPHQGRRLDFAVNQLLYAGPIVAGATMMDHFEDFREFEAVHIAFFTRIPAFMEGHQAVVMRWVIGLGTALLAYYVHAQWRMARQGRVVSWQKVYLLTSTGLVSIYTWGLNTWGEAFLIMNVFHALQYFGIVWATERANLRRSFRLERVPGGGVLTWWIFVGSAVAYGIAVEAWADGRSMTWWSVTIVVSLMHFWYDGFVWSVRKARE
ncbi:hypothetical protein [Paraliomyxa miuraensis]|uniref:hypothetical protein n=1 Tax=Paraliomyxa miuraensis TaxID=376150 RepID=UPI00224DF431|nr:hypothetical protein [Paraliomyxa miuraensis]MCX4246220.1 hypothetical protein [Paraliomyxa miuraensis]